MSSLHSRQKVASTFLLALLLAAVAWPAGAAELKLSTSSLSFVAVAGKSPAPQQFSAYSNPAVSGFSPTLLATTQTGNWLAVSTSVGGSFPSSVGVWAVVNSASLPVGDYAGQITVTQPGLDNSPASVAVSLKVIPAVPYILVNPAALNVQAKVGIDPASLSVVAINVGVGTLSPSFSASTANGGNWLTLSQPTGGSFGNSDAVRVDIHSAALSAGTYNGTVTVTSPTAANSPLNVPVKLVVGASGGAVISVAPASLSFVAGLGADPRSQAVSVNNSGTDVLRPTVSTSTTSGGPWLVTYGNGGSFGSNSVFTVNAHIDGLQKGTYTGNVRISDPSAANTPVDVPVALLVEDPKPAMRLSNPGAVFSSPVGDFIMETSNSVLNIGTGVLKWSATTDQPWLFISPPGDEAIVDNGVIVRVSTIGLSAGIHRGSITFTSNAVSGASTQTYSVVLGVGVPLPAVNAGGVVNGASFASTTVAPGAIVSVFGVNLGPKGGLLAALVGGKLPTQLGNVRVLFNGTPAPLFYVSDVQLNVQTPMELAGSSSASVQVVTNDLPSAPMNVNLRAADPGVFLVAGLPGIFFANSTTQVTPQTQAKAGDYLTLWATGLGVLESAVETGAPATAALRTRLVAKVLLGGVPAPVLYAGLAPGFVGLYQVNIQVPDTVPSGNTSLILSMGGTETAPMVVPIR